MIIMHPRPSGMQIAIDSKLLILSFELKFMCADMFPYEDTKILSVCNSSKEITLASSIPVIH